MASKILSLLLAVVVLLSCQTPVGQRRSINEWIGYHADDLVRVWGPPLGEYQFQNGDKVMQYMESDINAFGSTGTDLLRCTPYGQCYNSWDYTPFTVTQMNCTTRFTVSRDLIIKNVLQQGSCRYFKSKLPPLKMTITANKIADQQPIANKSKKRYCREYTSTVIIDGKPQQLLGTKCLMPDGRWAPAN